MDKKASDVLKSRGFWNNVIGAFVTMIVTIALYVVREFGLPIDEDVIQMIVGTIAATFVVNVFGYKWQDGRRALNEAPKG